MQLDQTRIVIRERSFPDLLDLSLAVFRAHAGALLVALAAGALPMALINYWLLHGLSEAADYDEDGSWAYAGLMAVLVIWQTPLATAPLTLYLGQALFVERPTARGILLDLGRSAWQLVLFQVVLRALLVWTCLGMFVVYLVYPYLNEIILLERNPWRSPRPSVVSTMQRAAAMHTGMLGDLLARWLMSVVAGALVLLALFGGGAWLHQTLVRSSSFEFTLLVIFPMALWLTVGFFAVVRFLAYLDTRIRSEGWEIELMMRAEGARLARQLS